MKALSFLGFAAADLYSVSCGMNSAEYVGGHFVFHVGKETHKDLFSQENKFCGHKSPNV